ncbi:MAG TPA: hypothetical protein VLD37_06100 [Candidatus Bilamarchaeum sp.]|nr:hypothetical protein [Candidatus Bilamarchaeum sp.]
MLERKKLAYGEGEKWVSRPKIMKSLVFSATFFACMTSCAPNISAIPTRDPVVEQARRETARRAPALERACRPNLANVLRKGESVRETVCRDGRDFVLTSTSLIIIERSREDSYRSTFEGPSIDRFFTRTDMSDIYARGLVDWEAGPDACYFLTADRSLTVYPNADMGDTVPSFTFSFDTRSLGRNAMVFHSGFAFMAAPGEEAIAFGGDGHKRMLGVFAGPGQSLTARGGRLFLGETEIVVRSQRIEEIEIRR